MQLNKTKFVIYINHFKSLHGSLLFFNNLLSKKARVPGAIRIRSNATRVKRKMFLPFSRKFEISSILTKFKEFSFFHVNCQENLRTFHVFDFLQKSLNSFRFREHYRKNKFFKFLQHQSKFFKADIRIGSFLTHNFLNAKK